MSGAQAPRAIIRPAAALAAVALLLGSGNAGAQFGRVSAPVIGHLWDAIGGAVRPLRGVPGSATIGPPVALGFAPTHVLTLGPAHLLASSAGDGALRIIDLTATPPAVTPIGHARVSPALSAASPRGTAAALYDPVAGQVVIVAGLPAGAAGVQIVDVPSQGGRVTHLAVSDDGGLLVYAAEQGGTASVHGWSPQTGVRYLWNTDAVSAIALTPGGDAVVANPVAHEVFVLQGGARGGPWRRLADAGHGVATPVGVAVSGADRVHVANAGVDTVITLDFAGRLTGTHTCRCEVAGLSPVREGVYRLTNGIDRTVYLLDARRGGERLVFVPPVP